jgi:alpha-tubulin suppressor-like RCC1 family protein
MQGYVSSGMRKMVTLLCVLVMFLGLLPPSSFFVLPAHATAGWYNSSYLYRKVITIDHSKVSGGDQTNFPVLISITNDANLKTTPTGYVQNSNGYDIVFTDSTGTTKLDHEIEKYDGANGTIAMWVRIPTLSASVDTVLYMYFGNSSVSNNPSVTTVWDSNYVSVWHSDETSGTTLSDSTAQTSTGAFMAYQTVTAGHPASDPNGKIAAALNYTSATKEWVDIHAISNKIQTGPVTYSLWFQLRNDFPSGYSQDAGLIGNNDGPSSNDVTLRLNYATGQLSFTTWNNSGRDDLYTSQNSWSAGVWYHIEATLNPTSTDKFLYINGVQQAHDTNGTRGTSYATHASLGAWASGGNQPPDSTWRYFDGWIDEARVSHTARSADWIATEYNNQSTPGAFYAISTAENAPPPPPAPVVQTLSPVAGAIGVDPLSQLSLTFDQNVSANTTWDATNTTGVITIGVVGGSVWETIQACDTTRVSISGDTVTIKPHFYFKSGVNYYVKIGSACFTNGSTYYAGISDQSTWSFTATPNIKVVQVATGTLGSLLLNSDGTVYAWGENGAGGIGDNTTTQRNAPVQVHGVGNSGYLTSIVAIAAGGRDCADGSSSYNNTNYALKSDGTVYAWGSNDCGQLGINTTDTNVHSTPVNVLDVGGSGSLTGILDICADSGSCVMALKNDGTAYAWGYNGYGQLGDNSTTNRKTPVQVSTLTTIVQIGIDDVGASVLTANGNVYAWGYNGNGEVGDNTTTQRNAPVQVHGVGNTGYLTNIVSLSVGSNAKKAVKNDGTVYAWGVNNFGQLGDNTTSQRNVPVQVLDAGGSGNLTGIVKISSTAGTSCALKSDGTVSTWGRNTYGQLGDNTTTQRKTPVQVVDVGGSGMLSQVTALSAGAACYTATPSGYDCMLALTNNGTVYAWGYNANGQLGDTTTSNRSAPVQVSYTYPTWVSPPGGTYTLGQASNQSYTVTLAGRTLSSVKNGATTLTAGTDYTWDAGTSALDLKASYLNTLPVGNTTLTLMDGATPLAVIGMVVSAGSATVSPSSNSYVIGQSNDQSYTVTLNGNTLSAGVTNSTTGDTLILDTDYTWSSPTLTLKAAYLNNQNTHKMSSNTSNTMTLNMSGGTNPTISVVALTNAVSFTTTFTHGAATDQTYDVYGSTFSAVKNGGTTLTQNTHYAYSSNVLTLYATYLNTLATGSYMVTVNFTGPQAGEGETVYILLIAN